MKYLLFDISGVGTQEVSHVECTPEPLMQDAANVSVSHRFRHKRSAKRACICIDDAKVT